MKRSQLKLWGFSSLLLALIFWISVGRSWWSKASSTSPNALQFFLSNGDQAPEVELEFLDKKGLPIQELTSKTDRSGAFRLSGKQQQHTGWVAIRAHVRVHGFEQRAVILRRQLRLPQRVDLEIP